MSPKISASFLRRFAVGRFSVLLRLQHGRGGFLNLRFKGEIMKMLKKLGLVSSSAAPLSAFAAGPDLSTLTAAVDFSTVTTALLGVGAAIIVVYISWKGAKMVLSAVKGA